MNIELPEKFFVGDEERFVKVRKNQLIIRGSWDWYRIMTQLSYDIYGKKQCYYCGKKINANKVTIDHLYSQDFGGVSITSNMRPCCEYCNTRKSNMNEKEFKVWNSQSSEEDKKSYYHFAVSEKKRKAHNPQIELGFDLPSEWIQYLKRNDIRITGRFIDANSKKYQKVLKFAQKTGKLSRPIVVSKNRFLLEGYNCYRVAKKMSMKKVPVVILENVILIPNPKLNGY